MTQSNIQETLNERGSRYGEFDEHARITQEIKAVLVSGRSWEKCNASQKEALEMIAHKLGRIVNGDPDYDDSWRDIAGYSQLIVNELVAPDSKDSSPQRPDGELVLSRKAPKTQLWGMRNKTIKEVTYLDDYGRPHTVVFDVRSPKLVNFLGDDLDSVTSVKFTDGIVWNFKEGFQNAEQKNVSPREPSIDNDRITSGSRNPDDSVSANGNPSDLCPEPHSDSNIHNRERDSVVPSKTLVQQNRSKMLAHIHALQEHFAVGTDFKTDKD